MPDPVAMTIALFAAAWVAGLVLLLLARPWRQTQPTRVHLAWLLGLSAGFGVGCGLLGLRPHWPPREDLDRFLLILLPSTLAIEVLAELKPRPLWIAWPPRLALSAVVTPILLHQTVYLTDLSGPGTREWSGMELALILTALAGTLAAVWVLLALLRSRTPGPAVTLALAMSCAAAGVAVMLSGYLSGGKPGLALGAALAGVALASMFLPAEAKAGRSIGVGVVGLFGVLLAGRFFGTLTTGPALCLFLAPLLAWIPECPGVRKFGPRVRAVAGLVFVAIPLILVILSAHGKFTDDSTKTSTPEGPSIEDYQSFGK